MTNKVNISFPKGSTLLLYLSAAKIQLFSETTKCFNKKLMSN